VLAISSVNEAARIRLALGRAHLGERARAYPVAGRSEDRREQKRKLAILPVDYPDWAERPKTRGDCFAGGSNAERPCPWAGCRHHLALEVSVVGSLKFRFPDLDADEIPETCCLDAADRGGLTLLEIGKRMNVSRERVRQLEEVGARAVERTKRLEEHRGREQPAGAIEYGDTEEGGAGPGVPFESRGAFGYGDARAAPLDADAHFAEKVWRIYDRRSEERLEELAELEREAGAGSSGPW
jgi:hypothetical protein